MLILDVKGNLHYKIKELCFSNDRKKDYIVIELGGKYKYNPLDKPNLKASVLANRLKTILLLFSGNNTESYWLDKAEQLIAETIKFCRLYNNNYVTFEELHKLICNQNYYKEKVVLLKEKFLKNNFTKEQCYDLLTCINFYEKEFLQLDNRTFSILKSEITRITNCFVSDYSVMQTFNPSKNESNLNIMKDIIKLGKIVVLNINIAEYKNLSKIISAYLKLDFQSEVLSQLSKKNNSINRKVCFICDEYHEFVTGTDAEFFAQSREAKCMNIVATQSYTSLLNTLNNPNSVKVIVQNLINKLWFRTDDIFTIEEAQKQVGKEDKEKISKNISENSKETKYNYFTQTFISKDSNISESFNSYLQHDFVYDTNFFTQELETFSCLAFLSNGEKILNPEKLKLEPFFKKGEKID
ncbi:MAG TPA: type IV secretion system DNA-binding domain-containing protein [Clostridia bacterium]|nr:type IV secretion system DNA-binding domain-containing protein [Clostridia bacterium]